LSIQAAVSASSPEEQIDPHRNDAELIP